MDNPVQKPKRKKKKWLIALVAVTGAALTLAESGLVPPVVGEVADQLLVVLGM